MATPIPSKRRRLNQSSDKLNRPFVSPFKGPKPTTKPTTDDHTDNIAYRPSIAAHTTAKFHANTDTPIATSSNTSPGIIHSLSKKSHGFPAASKSKTSEEIAAQRALTALEIRIRTVGKEIDTLKQAAQISSSTTDTDLEDLTHKWTVATRAAAEELFGTVKERVCRMGGVAAWRESEKRKYERSHGLGEFAEPMQDEDDGADCEFDSQGEELPPEEQEYRKKQKRKARQEMMDAADSDGPEVEGGGGDAAAWHQSGQDDDAFTMDMMLRSLNIDLHLIGYDRVAQRWVD